MTKYRLGPAVTYRVSRLHEGGAILARRYGRWLTGIQTPPPAPPADEEPEEEQDGGEKPKKSKKKAKGKKAAEKPPEKKGDAPGESADEKGPRRSAASALRRIAGSGGVAYLGAQALATSTWLLWPTTIATLAAAYRAGAPSEDVEQQDVEAAEEPEQQQDEEEPHGPSDGEFVALLRELVGNGPGVHLAEIPPALAARWPHRQWDGTDVRALAGEAGLPISGTRSATRAGSSTCIRRKDLPPPPIGDPAHGAVVAAGQAANNNANNEITVERGAGYAIFRHASDAARHHTIA